MAESFAQYFSEFSILSLVRLVDLLGGDDLGGVGDVRGVIVDHLL